MAYIEQLQNELNGLKIQMNEIKKEYSLAQQELAKIPALEEKLADKEQEIVQLNGRIETAAQKNMLDTQAMKERYGLTPRQFIDLKGLMGDKSDNIPGIPGETMLIHLLWFFYHLL